MNICHPFQKNLKDSVLSKLELFNQDRVLVFHFASEKGSFKLIAELFSKSPNLYLLDVNGQIIWSLHPSKSSTYTFPPRQSNTTISQARFFTSVEVEKYYQDLEGKAEFENEKRLVENKLKSDLKRIRRFQKNAQEAYEACLTWPRLEHEAQVLAAHLYQLKRGVKEISLADWEKEGETLKFAFDPQIEPKEEVARRFRQVKKLKSGLEQSKIQTERAEREGAKVERLLQVVKQIETREELQGFCREHQIVMSSQQISKAEKPPTLPYREFLSEAGIKLWVGKSAKDNDKMTFSFASGSDWWLHARDVPGSHVIIKVAKNREPDQETLKDAMQLALYYSKAKDEGKGEIVVTQRKYVSRVGKDRAGRVSLSKHKIYYITLEQKRLSKILGRG